MDLIIGQIYRHFKGDLYKVICVATDSEDGRELVIYQALYGENKIYARPKDMFLSKVDKIKYPNATQEYRFEVWDGLKDSALSAPIITNEVKGENLDANEASKDDEEPKLDEGVLDFLDADTFEKKLEILQGMQNRITDQMISTMAYAMDLEINEGSTQDKYHELLNCVMLRERFECNRLR